jgi:hypothetical protein
MNPGTINNILLKCRRILFTERLKIHGKIQNSARERIKRRVPLFAETRFYTGTHEKDNQERGEKVFHGITSFQQIRF